MVSRAASGRTMGDDEETLILCLLVIINRSMVHCVALSILAESPERSLLRPGLIRSNIRRGLSDLAACRSLRHQRSRQFGYGHEQRQNGVNGEECKC